MALEARAVDFDAIHIVGTVRSRASDFCLACDVEFPENPGIPITVPTPEDCMSSRIPEATDAEARTEGIDDLLAQAQTLAERVEAMPDGPMKQKLRAALAEIKANVREFKPEVRHAG
jgi:hypothetical protein